MLWALSQAGLDYVRETIAETEMPGVALTQGGWLMVGKTDNADAAREETAFLRTNFGADVAMWPTPKVRAHLKTSHYFQAVHFRDAFHIHPLNYAIGLAKNAEDAGVRIFENTPALSIDPVGVRKRVVTPNARVRAGHVVLAGNVHLGESDAASRAHAGAGDDLCRRHRAAWRRNHRGDRLQRLGERHAAGRQSLPARRRPADLVRPHDRA